MSDTHLARLAALAQEVTFPEDQIIFRAGEKSGHFYLVVSGGVCVEISTPVYAICVQTLGSGDAFGWSSLLDHHETVFQVRARERCRALLLEASQLAVACRDDPEFGCCLYLRLFEIVARRVKAIEARLAEVYGIAQPVPKRRLVKC
jgi:CRP-like cAMP-binding protein